MHGRKKGTLESGRSGKKMTSRNQAIAIGLAEARMDGKKAAKKRVPPPRRWRTPTTRSGFTPLRSSLSQRRDECAVSTPAQGGVKSQAATDNKAAQLGQNDCKAQAGGQWPVWLTRQFLTKILDLVWVLV
jgi:hypothetical protein